MKLAKALAVLIAVTLPAAWAAKEKKAEAAPAEDTSRMTAATFKGLELRSIGPALMSGRIADIAVDPTDQSVWYVGVGSGGVWKTTNAGTTWSSVFDGQGSYSIGCITVDPNDPATVWVGTGENVGGRHVGYGDGIYRSRDGGLSWENVGLKESEHIGNIIVHPEDSNTLYVAVQGPLWTAGGERGLYKTSDGGVTWEKILGGGEYTGVNEVRMDPRDPQVLYAATHQRFRNVAALIDGGPESGIHKSEDGGKSWRELTRGLPEEDMGKIGLAISPQRPDVVYATIELAHRTGGFYRSEDGGESWEKRSDYLSGGTGPHYYQEIFASPHRFDRIYQMDPRMHVSEDGGWTFTEVGEEHKHGDNHALAFDPNDPNYLLNGADGGVYESWDLGKSWKFVANLPVTQFYKVAVDYDEPFYHVVGGTQDNNTQYGPSRTDNVHGIRNSDWQITLFGDGHQPAIDPTDPDIVYSEWQEGNLTRWDRKTGEIVYIQPQPGPDEEWDRFNWDSPILISAHDPARLYFASQRVWRSDDRGDSWTAISGDLSRGEDRLTLPMMGRVWSFDAIWDLWAMSKYATVTSLGESPLVDGLVYAGTDDGLIQVTEDGGRNWRRIDSLPGVADSFFVNDIKADLHDADTVYAVVDNHKRGDLSPYVYRSTDRGRTWSSIRGDLPDRHLVWRLVQDHVDPNLLFAGTEFGVFFTADGGRKWIKLEGAAPTIPFRDLAIQKRENDLVGATFGRGFYILDDYSPLRGISERTLEQEAELFPVKDAWWYIQRRTLGGGQKATQGADFYTAENPPFGAVFTYYLRDELKTRKAARREQEKKIKEAGGDNPYPGWDALRQEEIEEDPAILLTVRNGAGDVVRRLQAPVTAGLHRVAWDLRYPDPSPYLPEEERGGPFERTGFLVAPGAYSVSMAKRVDGVVTDLGKSQTFQVVPLRERGLEGAEPEVVAAFWRELAEMDRVAEASRALFRETEAKLAAMKGALMQSTVPNQELDARVRDIERRVKALHERLAGNERRDSYGDPGPVHVMRRLGVVGIGNSLSTYGPTEMHRRQFEIAQQDFAGIRSEFASILETEMPALEADLDAAGVPWSTGRGVPGGR